MRVCRKLVCHQTYYLLLAAYYSSILVDAEADGLGDFGAFEAYGMGEIAQKSEAVAAAASLGEGVVFA